MADISETPRLRFCVLLCSTAVTHKAIVLLSTVHGCWDVIAICLGFIADTLSRKSLDKWAAVRSARRFKVHSAPHYRSVRGTDSTSFKGTKSAAAFHARVLEQTVLLFNNSRGSNAGRRTKGESFSLPISYSHGRVTHEILESLGRFFVVFLYTHLFAVVAI